MNKWEVLCAGVHARGDEGAIARIGAVRAAPQRREIADGEKSEKRRSWGDDTVDKGEYEN
jgi:hypothetical protein